MSTIEGAWVNDPTDAKSIREMGRVTLVFSSAGQLTYTIHADKKDEITLMTYRVDGNELITVQPAQAREERTRYELSQDGRLLLYFGDEEFKFCRCERP